MAMPTLTVALVDADIESPSDSDARLVSRFGALPLAELGPGLRAALARLCAGGASEEDLVALVRERGAASELPALFYYLRVFDGSGQLARTLVLDEVQRGDEERPAPALLRVIPISPGYDHALAELDPAAPLRLSRFALMRRFRGALMLESPRTHARVELIDPRAAALVHALASDAGLSLAALATDPSVGLSEDALGPALRLLLATGHLVTREGDVEDQPTLALWSFHDLVFHARSRAGRHDLYNGKTYPFRGQFPPLPAVRPLPEGPRIELPRPAADELAARELGFDAVLDARRSIRAWGETPISLAQLGEFLHRCARIRQLRPADSADDYDTSIRVAPGGGGCYELELYLAVDRAVDLDGGLYHYDPEGHRLTQVRGHDAALERLLADTKVASGSETVAQVMVCIASRFGRMAWPYEGIVYATTLKNVGAMLQTMYLVGTAMGLATCAVGRSDADLFAELAGTDYYAETTVGEFMLGTRA